MAVVVNVEAAVDTVEYPGDYSSSDYRNLMLLTLDDGTATVGILTPDYMLQKLQVRPGLTVECTVWLRQRGTIKKWYAYCMSLVTDPHAEILRWMELSFQPEPNESLEYGYPTIQRNAAEALRLITLETQHCNDGVSLEELAMVMQVSPDAMKDMLVELQLDGQIYQNQLGNYVPL